MTLAANLKALDALSGLTSDLATGPDAAPPPPPNGVTFTWKSDNSGNFYGGWLLGGLPEAGDTADMSVTGADYTVLCDNFSTTSDGGTITVTDYVVGSVILGVNTTLEIDPNSFDLQNGGTNNGEILVDYVLTLGNSGSNTVRLTGKGGGEINLNDSYTNATLTGYNSSSILDLQDQTIVGAGTISNLTLSIDKTSSIDASGTNNTFVLNPGNTIYSEGTIAANTGATLIIENVTIDESAFVKGDDAGIIESITPTSKVELDSVHIEGGGLYGYGLLQFDDAGSIVDGSTSAGAVTIVGDVLSAGGDTVTFKGMILNHGAIEIQSNTQLTIDPAGVTFSSGGVGAKGALMFDDSANVINSNGAAVTLTNVDNTISGSVTIYNTTIVNETGGVIDATGATGQMIIGASDVLKNSGLLEATGAAGLSISSQVIDATLGGTLVVGDGSQIDLASDTFDGGVISAIGTGKWVLEDSQNVLDGSTASGAVTLETTLTSMSGDTLTLRGVFHNEGLLSVQSNTQLTIDGTTGVTLDSGGLTTKGKVTFDDTANVINSTGAAETLTNVDNTISGAVTFYNMTIKNEVGGTIDATGKTNQIVIGSSDILKNSGLLEATGAAGLSISNQVIDAALGGTLVVGAGSQIDLASDTFDGGVISAIGTGKWVLEDSQNVLDGSTASGAVTLKTTLAASSGDTLTLRGVIHNEGVLSVQSNTQLTIDGANGVTLDSGGLATKGKVTFDDSSNVINSTGLAETLTNVDNTISGAVTFYNMTIKNEVGGTIDATGATDQIAIGGSDKLENSGLLEATGAAGIAISSQVIDGALGGTILAGSGSQIDIASDTFDGGVISAVGTGKWVLEDSQNVLDGSTASGAVTLKTTLAAISGNTLTLKGLIHNEGVLSVKSNTQLTIDGTTGVTLDSGGLTTKGKVTFDDSSNVINSTGLAETLTNVDNTISGAVTFYNMNIVNDAKGVINATGATTQMSIGGSDGVTNAGLIEATGAAGLSIASATVHNSGGTISAGAGSKVQLYSDLITSGSLTTTGSGIIEIADSGTDLSAGAVANGLTLAATIQIDDGQTLAITGSVVNTGKIEVGVTGAATLELGATLSGGGAVSLFDSASSAITVGFNNVDNTISGAGTISAHIQQQSGGVIEATHLDHALILSTGAAIANAGVLEANAGNLIVEDAVTGVGHVVITNGGSASFAAAFSENVSFLGANAGTLDLTDAYTGSITGFGVGDAIELLGLSADSVTLNASNQLVVKSGATTVATLQLSGAYAGDVFLAEINAAGVKIFELPTPTIAQYLAAKSYYDALPGGFEIIDSATNIQANLTVLGADAAVVKIASNSGLVTVSVATFKTSAAAVDKVFGGVVVADTGANLVASLSALVADAAHIHAIALTSGTLSVTTAQFDSYKTLLNTIPSGFTVADTAAHIQSDLAGLQADAANIAVISVTSGSVTVSTAVFLANQAALDKIFGGFTLSDTAGNLLAHIATIAADAAHIAAVSISGVAVTVSASQATTYRTLLDKISGGFAVSDTAANILVNLAALFADAAKITSILSTTGDVIVSDATFELDRSLLDKISPGVTVTDTATAILADLAGLGGDAHVDKINLSSGAVSVSVATFLSGRTALDKIVGGFAISDTASAIVGALNALLADAAHIHSITLTSGSLSVTTSQFDTYKALLNTFAAGFVVADTAANILADLSMLQADAGKISAITLTSGAMIVTAAQFAANQAALDKIGGGFTITDTAANIVANLDKIAADSLHILAVNVTGSVVVSASQAVSDRATLDKIAGGFAVSDTAANIQTNLGSLFADTAHIVAITSTSGAVTVSDATFLANRALLDKVTTGFVVSDTAAHIVADLANLAADGHISKIITSDAVQVTVANFSASQALLDKISNGFVISDTAANILAALAAIQADIAHIQSISATSGTITVSTAQFTAAQIVFDKIVGGVAISDTAANIRGSLAALEADAAHISAITLTSGALTLTAAAFATNQAFFDKVVGGVAIADTAANFVANLAPINADLAHIKSLAITGAVVVSASQAASARAALDKISGGFSISDTAANIQAVLASLFADNANIVSITATGGNVTVTDAAFESQRALLDKITPGVVISDLGANIVGDLAALKLDKSHIAALVATDAPATVSYATYASYAGLLNRFVGGVAIKDVASAIKLNLSAIAANIAHIASLTSTNKTLKVSAASFVTYQTTLDKVTGGVAISDTEADIIAAAPSLLGDLAHIQSLYFTDVVTPTLKLNAFQVALLQPVLSKIANDYILDEKLSPGVFVTTGHGDSLTIADVPTDDTITGGGASETFVFGNQLGHATLVDFSQHLSGATHDTIQLTVADYGGFNMLTTKEASQHGTDVWLTSKTTGDVIVIDNLTTGQLGGLTADFKLV